MFRGRSFSVVIITGVLFCRVYKIESHAKKKYSTNPTQKEKNVIIMPSTENGASVFVPNFFFFLPNATFKTSVGRLRRKKSIKKNAYIHYPIPVITHNTYLCCIVTSCLQFELKFYYEIIQYYLQKTKVC